MSSSSLRRDYLTKPIFGWAKGVLPKMSDTEREALEAGDVWWDADLFTGNPDWAKLLAVKPATLTAEEQAFMTGPVDRLCEMIDDWQINWELRDELEPRAACLLPALLLARVDGKSPVEYITEEADKERVRKVARFLLTERTERLETVRDAWAAEL